MSLEDMAVVGRIRDLRERLAEEAHSAARARAQEAERLVMEAEMALAAFDGYVSERLRAFHERAIGGVSPTRVTAMQAFHGDMRRHREGYAKRIDLARIELRRAQEAAEEARRLWVIARNRAEAAQTAVKDLRAELRREGERRIERDADELSLARAARREDHP